ncbi:MAG: YqeG family HAD IIIA-type phosphatase [Lawsonibacter sp.]
MPVSPIPRGVYPSVTALDPKALRARGITLVLADLDNTLVPYGVTEPPEEIVAWKQALEAQGIQLFLLSNSRRPGRAQGFAQRLGIPIRGTPASPGGRAISGPWSAWGCRPEETVMVGDQIFTDTLGANNAGVVPMLVEPIRLAGNPGRYLRYAAETPFRLLGKRRPFL